jgi:hypothetical protein
LLLRTSAIPQKTAISTEAAHSILVSKAVEKFASLPPPFPNADNALRLRFWFSSRSLL